METRCKTSINGLRVTDAIAALLPSEHTYDANINVFRTVIRFLKHWAKRRCV
jgi:poly(A) polymerase Pap1